MTRTIAGSLNPAALARLHFHTLDSEAKATTVRRLAATGQTDTTIAAATGLSVEMVGRILADHARGAR
jgi:hypothetical protein